MDRPYYAHETLGNLNEPRSILFFDQEPFYSKIFIGSGTSSWFFNPAQHKILVTSEKSQELTSFTQRQNVTQMYYFFHAIAALEWYSDSKYRWGYNPNIPHKKLFLNYNNLLTKFRSHRIDFVSRIYESGLIDQGYVSFASPGAEILEDAVLSNELYSPTSYNIFDRNRDNLNTKLVIDTDKPHGVLSSTINLEDCQTSLVHVVSETVFYQDKLHLTEKIFKPIAAGQPFLLLAAPGNLAYLREYGFRTFSDFWDEGYDNIVDPGQRIAAVVQILEDLSNLTYTQQLSLKKEMSDVTRHNFYHFYKDLRPIVITELVNNLEAAFKQTDMAVNKTELQDLYKLLTL